MTSNIHFYLLIFIFFCYFICSSISFRSTFPISSNNIRWERRTFAKYQPISKTRLFLVAMKARNQKKFPVPETKRQEIRRKASVRIKTQMKEGLVRRVKQDAELPRDIIQELLDENLTPPYEDPHVGVSNVGPIVDPMPDDDQLTPPEGILERFRFRKVDADAHIGLEDLARGERRPALTDYYDPPQPEGFDVDTFEKRYVMIGFFNHSDPAVLDYRQKIWDYHLQWGRRTALIDEMRQRRFFLPNEFLVHIHTDLSYKVLVEEELTLLSYDRLTPIAQIITIKVNSTNDIFEYLSIEPFLTHGLLTNANQRWEIFPMTYSYEAESNNFTLNQDIFKPFYVFGYEQFNIQKICKDILGISSPAALFNPANPNLAANPNPLGLPPLDLPSDWERRFHRLQSLLIKDNQRIFMEFQNLTETILKQKFRRHTLLYHENVFQQFPPEQPVLRPHEYAVSNRSIPRISELIYGEINETMDILSNLTRDYEHQQHLWSLTLQKKAAGSSKQAQSIQTNYLRPLTEQIQVHLAHLLYLKYQLHQLFISFYSYYMMYDYQFFDYEEKAKTTWLHNDRSRICFYQPIKEKLDYPVDYQFPAKIFLQKPKEWSEINSTEPIEAIPVDEESCEQIPFVTFPSKEETLKYSLLELDERKKEFEKKFNFSFPLPFACLYDESLYPPSYESPPTSSAHIGVQMIVNAVTNGDILRFLRNDLLVKQFFPDQQLFYDLKGMVRQGPIYNTSDELYDRMLITSPMNIQDVDGLNLCPPFLPGNDTDEPTNHLGSGLGDECNLVPTGVEIFHNEDPQDYLKVEDESFPNDFYNRRENYRVLNELKRTGVGGLFRIFNSIARDKAKLRNMRERYPKLKEEFINMTQEYLIEPKKPVENPFKSNLDLGWTWDPSDKKAAKARIASLLNNDNETDVQISLPGLAKDEEYGSEDMDGYNEEEEEEIDFEALEHTDKKLRRSRGDDEVEDEAVDDTEEDYSDELLDDVGFDAEGRRIVSKSPAESIEEEIRLAAERRRKLQEINNLQAQMKSREKKETAQQIEKEHAELIEKMKAKGRSGKGKAKTGRGKKQGEKKEEEQQREQQEPEEEPDHEDGLTRDFDEPEEMEGSDFSLEEDYDDFGQE